MRSPKKAPAGGLPDLRWINRKVPISDIAKRLGLRFSGQRQIHCWHPDRHQHGDRTASVGIRIKNNTVKCFGCDTKPMGPVDLVVDVLSFESPLQAALWVADRFTVPCIPKGKHLDQPAWHIGRRAGFEGEVGVLVQSGLWARLSAPSRSIAPVLAYFADRTPGQRTATLTISYRAISRYSGVNSPNAVAKAIRELSEIGWLTRENAAAAPGQTVRATNRFLITPESNELIELAQSHVKQMKDEIEGERELRKQRRVERIQSLRESHNTGTPHAATKYKSLYSSNSGEQNGAIPRIAGIWRGRRLCRMVTRSRRGHRSRRRRQTDAIEPFWSTSIRFSVRPRTPNTTGVEQPRDTVIRAWYFGLIRGCETLNISQPEPGMAVTI